MTAEAATMELSVVIPCLNEADTLANCIEKAKRAMDASGIEGEVIVADNGSNDRSDGIAASLAARVVKVDENGYGNALMGGIAAARGKYVIIGDGDDSYDFSEIRKFLAKLREGYDLVQGCRFPSGGGVILPGAMPFLHRWFGNPFFSVLVSWCFKSSLHDVYCGMRGFRRDFYDRLNLRCTGMEFAIEMIVKASMCKAKIAEVPLSLHRHGRKAHDSHLRTFRDGWRTLRLLLMFYRSQR